MGPHEIDLAGSPEVVRPAYPAHDTAGAVVDGDQRDIGVVRRLMSLVTHQLRHRRLQVEAHGGRHYRAGGLAGEPGREMWCVHRHGKPMAGRGFAGGSIEGGTIDRAILETTFED